MGNLKRILSITLGGIILIGTTTSLGATGKVNAPNGLILRKEAKSGDNIIMTISDNSKVEVLEKDGEWYKVKYKSHEGYLFAEYVEVEEAQKEEETESKENEKEETVQEELEENKTEENENTEKQYPKKQTTKSDLKIYVIPSITAKTIATVKSDKEITINYELNNWVNVTYGKTTGWARKYFIEESVEDSKEEVKEDKKEENKEQDDKKEDSKKEDKTESTETIIDNKKGYVDVSSSANIRKKASTDSEIIERLLRSTEVTIVAEEGDFYKIKYQDITGYIAKSLVSAKPVEDVTSRGNSGERKEEIKKEQLEEDKPEKNETTNKDTSNKKISKGNEIVSYAKKYVGYDYVSGGSSPKTGFDCSGLTYYVYNSFGYSMERTATAQSRMGKSVSRENLTAGDLIFFNNGGDGSIGHVGIYIGGGQFVHAENSRTGVRIDTINSGYYNRYYYTARRIIN